MIKVTLKQHSLLFGPGANESYNALMYYFFVTDKCHLGKGQCNIKFH
jgi:hypothetical protein